jgi:hypothetical protein
MQTSANFHFTFILFLLYCFNFIYFGVWFLYLFVFPYEEPSDCHEDVCFLCHYPGKAGRIPYVPSYYLPPKEYSALLTLDQTLILCR